MNNVCGLVIISKILITSIADGFVRLTHFDFVTFNTAR